MNQALDPKLIEEFVSDHGQWQAYLNLSFEQRQRGVRLVSNEHKGPLYVQKTFYPEGPDCAHAYLLHPPGGLVTGDVLEINVTVGESSHALITTPGAGRVYRARDDSGVQTQTMHFDVQRDAVLEWLPLENILFPGSHARMDTRIDLKEGARIMAWEVSCFGLPANQLGFDKGSCDQRLQIWKNDRILFNECLNLKDGDGFLNDGDGSLNDGDASLKNGAAGLRGLPVNALFVAGPFQESSEPEYLALKESLNELTAQTGPGEFLAASHVGEFMTVRYLGQCSERARLLLSEAWSLLRPIIIEREAVMPRIWAT